MSGLIVFLGPSLPAREAHRLARCKVLPPARQGDVWRALELRPRVIALIDGLFELQPSVWHREILSAIDAGVAVFGAASMGALRAAELDRLGMVGIGAVYQGYASGRLIDDAEVALLHASAEDNFRPLTVPLVQVRHVAGSAQRGRILTRGEGDALVEAGEAVFYQERTWPELFRRWGSNIRPARLARFKEWLNAGVDDVKAADARACLAAAEAFRRSPPIVNLGSPPGSQPIESSLVRRARLSLGAHPSSVRSLQRGMDAGTSESQRRLLLAGWARAVGLRIRPSELEHERRRWLASVPRREAARLSREMLDRLLIDALLERRLVELAPWVLSDGPAEA